MADVGNDRVMVQAFVWDKIQHRYVATGDPIDDHEDELEKIDMGPRPRGKRFLKGPIPWDWVVRAERLRGKALTVGLCLWRLAGATGKRTIALANSEVEPFGIDRAAKSRALGALEKEGLILMQRQPGRWPIVTLLEPAIMPSGEETKLGSHTRPAQPDSSSQARPAGQLDRSPKIPLRLGRPGNITDMDADPGRTCG